MRKLKKLWSILLKALIFDVFQSAGLKFSGFEMSTKLGAVVVPYSSKSEETRQLMLERSKDGFTIKKDGVWYIFL